MLDNFSCSVTERCWFCSRIVSDFWFKSVIFIPNSTIVVIERWKSWVKEARDWVDWFKSVVELANCWWAVIKSAVACTNLSANWLLSIFSEASRKPSALFCNFWEDSWIFKYTCSAKSLALLLLLIISPIFCSSIAVDWENLPWVSAKLAVNLSILPEKLLFSINSDACLKSSTLFFSSWEDCVNSRFACVIIGTCSLSSKAERWKVVAPVDKVPAVSVNLSQTWVTNLAVSWLPSAISLATFPKEDSNTIFTSWWKLVRNACCLSTMRLTALSKRLFPSTVGCKMLSK